MTLARHWLHDPSVTYLNHGSYGGTPVPVLAAQSALRDRMERELIRFFVEDYESLADRARHALADFLRCDWDCIAPVPNATFGVTTVVEHLATSGYLKPGDQILTNSHEYPACQNNLRRAASRCSAVVVNADIPFPIRAADEAVAAILNKVTPRTRLALISHVTSPTGLVLPIESLVPTLEARGVRTLIDGAHAPGMIPLDLAALNPSYYTANCHKWICSPKGSAFLYVRRDLRDGLRPLVLSNNAEKPKPGRHQFLTEFEYVGTQDYTAFLAIPAAIDFMASLVPGGWSEIRQRNHDLCLEGRGILCDRLGLTPPAPDSMIGSISTLVLPPHEPERHARLMARPSRYHDALQDALIARHGVQVPIWGLAGQPARFVRISAQLNNSADQYHKLAAALSAELAAEREW